MKKLKIKKSIIIASAFVFTAAIFLFLFYIVRFEKSSPIPGVMFMQGDETPYETTVCFKGEWNYQRISQDFKTFEGQAEIDKLDFTKKEDLWETEIHFEPLNNAGKEILRGGYFLNDSRARPIAHGLVYAGKKLDCFYFYIGESENLGNGDYIVVAPATTEEEAYEVMEELGLDAEYIKESFIYKAE